MEATSWDGRVFIWIRKTVDFSKLCTLPQSIHSWHHSEFHGVHDTFLWQTWQEQQIDHAWDSPYIKGICSETFTWLQQAPSQGQQEDKVWALGRSNHNAHEYSSYKHPSAFL